MDHMARPHCMECSRPPWLGLTKPVPMDWILQTVLSLPESEAIGFDNFPEFAWVSPDPPGKEFQNHDPGRESCDEVVHTSSAKFRPHAIKYFC